MEDLLVGRIIAAVWRLRRLGRVEASIFAWEPYEELAGQAEREVRRYERGLLDAMGDDLGKPEITDKKMHEEALSKAREMRAEQDPETATLGRTFVKDADKTNAFSKLSRYETTTTERSLDN